MWPSRCMGFHHLWIISILHECHSYQVGIMSLGGISSLFLYIFIKWENFSLVIISRPLWFSIVYCPFWCHGALIHCCWDELLLFPRSRDPWQFQQLGRQGIHILLLKQGISSNFYLEVYLHPRYTIYFTYWSQVYLIYIRFTDWYNNNSCIIFKLLFLVYHFYVAFINIFLGLCRHAMLIWICFVFCLPYAGVARLGSSSSVNSHNLSRKTRRKKKLWKIDWLFNFLSKNF